MAADIESAWPDKDEQVSRNSRGGFAALPVDQANIDGEIAVPDTRGISDYAALRQVFARSGSDEMVLYAFDLLYLDGCDLRPAKLLDRKAILARILASCSSPRVQLSEHVETEGPILFRHACEMCR